MRKAKAADMRAGPRPSWMAATSTAAKNTIDSRVMSNAR
jgi:hypothetical protein